MVRLKIAVAIKEGGRGRGKGRGEGRGEDRLRGLGGKESIDRKVLNVKRKEVDGQEVGGKIGNEGKNEI